MNQPSNVFVALEIKQQKTARIFVKQPLIKIAAMIVLVHITKYSNIFVRNLRIFEYIRTLTFQWSEYSNIFVFQFFYIRIRISNIRPEIFEYSNIFEYPLRSGSPILSPPVSACCRHSFFHFDFLFESPMVNTE